MFKKGDKVYAISNWDGKGAVAICILEIQSWEEDHVTATHYDSGEYIQHQFSHYFLVGSVDPETEALKIAEAILERKRALYAHYLASEHFSAAHKKATKKDLTELHEPRVLWR